MPRRITLPCTASTVLALSVDAKGVVMRPEALRPVTRQAAAATPRAFRTRLTAGEKPARIRMATLACVYDAEPAARRPHDVIAPPGGRRGRRRTRPGPAARAKWLTASLAQDPAQVSPAPSTRPKPATPTTRAPGWCRSTAPGTRST